MWDKNWLRLVNITRFGCLSLFPNSFNKVLFFITKNTFIPYRLSYHQARSCPCAIHMILTKTISKSFHCRQSHPVRFFVIKNWINLTILRLTKKKSGWVALPMKIKLKLQQIVFITILWQNKRHSEMTGVFKCPYHLYRSY